MQKRSMEKQRKLQALVALGRAQSDNKSSMPPSKTQSTLLSQDKAKNDMKGLNMAFGSAMSGVAGAVIGSIAAATSTSGQPFPTPRPGDGNSAAGSTINDGLGVCVKTENNSDEQDRSSSPGFDSDDDNVEQDPQDEIKEPKKGKRNKKLGLRKRSPSSGIQIPIPHLDTTPVSPKEKSFMQLVLPTPNLIDTSSSIVATKAVLHHSDSGQKILKIEKPTTSTSDEDASTSNLQSGFTTTPKSERPSVLNIISVSYIDQEISSPIKKENVNLECLNRSKPDTNASHSIKSPEVQSQQKICDISYKTAQPNHDVTPLKDVIVETKNKDTVTRVAKPSDRVSVTEQDITLISNVSDTQTERVQRNLVTALSKKMKVVGKKKRKKSDKRHKSKSENRARKALRTISFILGAFVFCWTPYHVVALVEGFCREERGCVNHHLFYFTYFLCYANSPINPFCYAMANQQFKKTFTRILKGDFHKT